MHEFSIASQILETAREHALDSDAADDGGADPGDAAVRIDRIEITVGEASHVNPDQLATCLDAAATDTLAAAASFEIDRITPYATCDCGWDGEPEVLDSALAYAPDLTCPECDSRLELQRGDGCHLQRLEVTGGDGDEPAEEPTEQHGARNS